MKLIWTIEHYLIKIPNNHLELRFFFYSKDKEISHQQISYSE